MQRCTVEPARVDTILDGSVRVQKLSPLVVERLEELGYSARQSRHGLEIQFDASNEAGRLENPSFVVLLQELSAHGVAFVADYKQMWSPAAIVSQLIEDGTEFKRPKGVGYDGSSWWVHDLPRDG